MSLVPSTVGTNTGIDIQVTSDLASEPVTATEAKLHLKIDYTDEDDLITSLIKVARQQLEKWSGLSFGAKTIKLFMASHKLSIPLPYGYIDTVTSVKASRFESGETTLTSGDHYLLVGNTHKTLTMYAHYNNLEITYTTQALNASFSESVKAAIKAQVAFLYNNRGDEEINKLDNVALMILGPHRKINGL